MPLEFFVPSTFASARLAARVLGYTITLPPHSRSPRVLVRPQFALISLAEQMILRRRSKLCGAVMSEHANVALIQRAYKAFMAGNSDAVRHLLADDLVWHIPGRHRFSGDHDKAGIMATLEEIVPEMSKSGKPVISTFNIELEDVVAGDEWAFARVHWNHTRDDKRFDQRGVEVFRLNAEGRIAEFWAFMRDTAAFDEFFA